MSLTAVKDAEKVDAKQTEAPLEDSLEVALELPPVIQQIAEDRREYQMNLGKAMDTLRRDMPYILKKRPGTYIRQQPCVQTVRFFLSFESRLTTACFPLFQTLASMTRIST